MLNAILKWLRAAAAISPLAPSSPRSLPTVEALDDRHLLSATASLLVPAYFYPVAGGGWDRMAADASNVPITAILNPNSGPGKKPDPVYASAVDQLRSNGGRVVGYVYTSNGNRPLSAVEKQVRAYSLFYHLDGIFIDEMATGPGRVAYYRSLYAYIKKLDPGYEVIGNPGTNTRQAYLTAPAADVLVDFEDNQRAYGSASPASWVFNHSSEDFANIVGQAASLTTMEADLMLAYQRNAGYVYMTDQNIDNNHTAYDRLPTYWDQEVAAIEAENAG